MTSNLDNDVDFMETRVQFLNKYCNHLQDEFYTHTRYRSSFNVYLLLLIFYDFYSLVMNMPKEPWSEIEDELINVVGVPLYHTSKTKTITCLVCKYNINQKTK